MILLDANPLIALADVRDHLHEQVESDLAELGKEDLYLPGPVLSEVLFVLRHDAHRVRIHQFIDDLGIRPWVSNDEQSLWPQVFAWLRRYADHSPDWADGYLAVISQLEPGFKIWTYDEEFRTIWRRPNGTKIPMVVKRREA